MLNESEPLFSVDEIPTQGELPTEELIERLAQGYVRRKAHHEASRLRQVRVRLGGPIGIAGFGDPHLDDDGCAWPDLQRDVRICQETKGILCVGVGDNSNNWVGRLMKLYAHQEVTSSQAIQLIEWFMLSLPWLVEKKGNHDEWNTDKGDPVDAMHRLHKRLSIMEGGSTRLQINLPAGCAVRMHVRHNFPGNSQFNPAHGMVRQTLFDYRDHILMCGHLHTAGYIPIWHNDPRQLCHGMRLGTYKDFDKYADDGGFKEANWARSMLAIVNPDQAHDPVRYIKVFFDLEEGADVLAWMRNRFKRGKPTTP